MEPTLIGSKFFIVHFQLLIIGAKPERAFINAGGESIFKRQ